MDIASMEHGHLHWHGVGVAVHACMHACRWSGQEFIVPMQPGMTMAELKEELQARTLVLTKRQKVRGARACIGRKSP